MWHLSTPRQPVLLWVWHWHLPGLSGESRSSGEPAHPTSPPQPAMKPSGAEGCSPCRGMSTRGRVGASLGPDPTESALGFLSMAEPYLVLRFPQQKYVLPLTIFLSCSPVVHKQFRGQHHLYPKGAQAASDPFLELLPFSLHPIFSQSYPGQTSMVRNILWSQPQIK